MCSSLPPADTRVNSSGTFGFLPTTRRYSISAPRYNLTDSALCLSLCLVKFERLLSVRLKLRKTSELFVVSDRSRGDNDAAQVDIVVGRVGAREKAIILAGARLRPINLGQILLLQPNKLAYKVRLDSF